MRESLRVVNMCALSTEAFSGTNELVNVTDVTSFTCGTYITLVTYILCSLVHAAMISESIDTEKC